MSSIVIVAVIALSSVPTLDIFWSRCLSYFIMVCCFFFFFKQKTAYEIHCVTGVQTCALPIAARAVAPVKVALQTPDGRRVEGELSFINNTVSTGTGTINLKATFPNREQALWPGAYVKTTVSAGVNKGAMVLPPHAILEGPAGRFAYVLDAGNKVAAKPVTLLRVQGQEAIIGGRQRGERVVLDGNQNGSPGAVGPIAPQAAVASTP